MEKGDQILKMMADSPFLQVGGRTIRLDVGLQIKENTTYIPLEEIGRAFGYLTEFDGEDFYVFRPESLVKEVKWSEDKQRIIIEMNNITPYRVYKSEDARELFVEIDETSLAEDFKDNISNKNYFLQVKKARNKARLQLAIHGKYAFPYQIEKGIEEKDNNIIINFFPTIESVKWDEEQLEIKSTGDFTTPEISFLKDPDRMVLDFPRIMLSDFDLELEDNEWVEDVRVSQFKYDPLTLRLVVELKEGKLLRPGQSDEDNLYSLQAADRTEISNFKHKETEINFESTVPLEPKFLQLAEPDRLVMDIHNAERSPDFPAELNVEGEVIDKIRTSRFNEDTIRMVVDLATSRSYDWMQSEIKDGKYLHTISFANRLRDIKLSDNERRSGIQIEFDKQVDYEIKKFSYPDRLVVDLKDEYVAIENMDFPEGKGIIKAVRESKYTQGEEEYARFIFELSEYNGHELISSVPGKDINIILPRGDLPEVDDKGILVVLDPGHGGFDPGAVGPSGLQEKEVNLAISKKVAENLRNAKKDYSILMTREKDHFVTLQERVKIANENEATLFISIHSNSASRDYSEGSETFHAPDKTADDEMLARMLQDEIKQELKLTDRGVKEESFYVIKYTEMPAALVEVAFLSNPHEESLLGSKLFRGKVAGAISRAIEKFIEAFDE
ncbi:MAG: N-acetylmuramoyl-L-alanine amidase [Halanaerobiales bacterium]